MLKPKPRQELHIDWLWKTHFLLQKVKSFVFWISEKWGVIEISWVRLDHQNSRKPTSPEISINDPESSRTKPQAWIHSVSVDWKVFEVWFYNYPWALAEAKYQWKRILSVEEWMNVFKSIHGDANTKANLLNMPMFWYRSASNNQFCASDDCVNYWTSTEVSVNSVQCIYLWEWSDGASRWYGNRGRGVPLRLAHY